VDFVIVTALIFFLWLAAKKTKKLLRRLEPDEQHAKREMIVIKAGFGGATTHLAEPETPAAEPERAAAAGAELPGPVFEVETAEPEPAAAGPWKEFTWEPGAEAAAVSAR
jgi:hypothetical protein